MINLKAQLKLTTVLFFGLISSMALAHHNSTYPDNHNTQTINANPDAYYNLVSGNTITFDILHSYTTDLPLFVGTAGGTTQLAPNTLGYLLHYDSSMIEYVDANLLYTNHNIQSPFDTANADKVENVADRNVFSFWQNSNVDGTLQYTTPYFITCDDNTIQFETDDLSNATAMCTAAGSFFGGTFTGGDIAPIPTTDFPLVNYNFRWISNSKTTTVTKIILDFNTISGGYGYTSNSDSSVTSTVAYNYMTLYATPITSTFAFQTEENSTAVGDIMGTLDKGDDTPTSVVINGGADADLFNIDFSADDGTAMLSFVDAPNFEAPQGGANDSSNDYEVIVLITANTYQEAQTVTISVTNVIEAPVLSGIPTLARVSSDYTFTPVVVNEEGKALTYTITGTLPSGLSFNTTTYTISGTPDTVSTASVSITAEFTDSGVRYAGTLTIALTVEDKLDQTIAFANTDVSKTFGDADFAEAISATSSTVATVYSSSIPTVATVTDGGTVTIVGAGTTIISANNAGDYDYNAISTSYVLTVAKADQPNFAFADDATRTITFISGDQVSAIVATGASGTGATTYASDNHNVAVATSTSGALAVQGAGVAIITATNPGDDNYNGASATYTITIDKAEQTGFAFADTGPIEKIADEAPFTNTASGGLGNGAITYALTFTADDGGTATVATIDSATGEVTLISAGIAIITATKAESDDYNQVTAVYQVNAAEPFNLDIDGNGALSASSDGILIARFLSNINATSIDISGTLAGSLDNRSDIDVLAYLQNGSELGHLDADGDGILSASSDGILISRFLSNTAALTIDISGTFAGGDNSSAEDVLTHLQGLLNSN